MSNKKQFDESISDLRSQIGSMHAEDDRVGHLRSLADDIERRFGSPGATEEPANLGERLTASILQFEGSHPRIAILLNDLAKKLGDIGI